MPESDRNGDQERGFSPHSRLCPPRNIRGTGVLAYIPPHRGFLARCGKFLHPEFRSQNKKLCEGQES